MSESPSTPEKKETEGGLSAANQSTLKPKYSKKRLLIIGGVCLVVLLGAIFFTWKKGYFPFSGKPDKTTEKQVKIKNLLNSRSLLGVPAVTANLDNQDGSVTYVKMAANVEIQGQQDSEAFQKVIPKIQDIFQTYLHETRPEELHGSGFYRLKESLLRRLRIELAPLNVTNIYITELLTQ